MKCIPLLTKLLALLVLMVGGFALLSYLGYTNMLEMKKSVDTIYFGTYIPVSKLERIRQLYTQDVVEIITNTQEGNLLVFEGLQRLQVVEKEIPQNWEYYKGIYKRSDEKTLIDAVDNEMLHALTWMHEMVRLFGKGDIKKIKALKLSLLLERINKIHEALGRVIDHENREAATLKKEVNEHYETTLQRLHWVLGTIFFTSIALSFFIIRNIQQNYGKLERLTDELRFANDNLKNLSITDPLTDVYNRRYFNVVAEKSLKRAAREKQPIAFMMIDIDFFKKYNDTYGHIMGDEVLRNVAQTLKNSLRRPGDYLFRLGGEEFGALIENTDNVRAQQIAIHLVRTIEAQNIEHKTSTTSQHVTISLGLVCAIPSSEESVEAIMRKADKALYIAKREGRNQAIIFNSDNINNLPESG